MTTESRKSVGSVPIAASLRPMSGSRSTIASSASLSMSREASKSTGAISDAMRHLHFSFGTSRARDADLSEAAGAAPLYSARPGAEWSALFSKDDDFHERRPGSWHVGRVYRRGRHRIGGNSRFEDPA